MTRSPTAGAAALALLAAASIAHAQPTYDFENLPIGIETPFALTSAGLTATFAGPSGVDPGAFGIGTDYPTPTGELFRLMTGDFLTVGTAFGAPGSALTIAFDAPIAALTFAFALDDPRGSPGLVLTSDTGATADLSGTRASGFAYPEGIGTFAPGTPFTSLTFSSSAIDFSLDDVVATPAAVPEPDVAWLVGAGVASAAFVRRRTRTARRAARCGAIPQENP